MPDDHQKLVNYVTTAPPAKCFIRDIYNLGEAKVPDWNEIWLLGTVPARRFNVVGLVVGVDDYEKRVVYTVDDGTETIECQFQKPIANEKPSRKGKEKAGPAAVVVHPVGETVSVVGRVDTWKKRRILIAEDIAAVGVMAEPQHWQEVAHLHNTRYSKPFICPRLSAPVPPTTPIKNRILQPSSQNVIAASSPPPGFSSPVKGGEAASSSLRHPVKLSSSQLNANTFRLHLVQFLDRASRPSASTYSTSSQSGASRGFSLSYLRRVPELDLLGRRIIRQEGRRRAKEAKLKERDERKRKTTKPKSSSLPSPQTSPRKGSQASGRISTERTSLKVKRLFQMTLRILRDDGNITIVDGPSRKFGKGDEEAIRRSCWREATSSSQVTQSTNSMSFQSQMSTFLESYSTDAYATLDPEKDPPSEPDEGEECYLPVNEHTLAAPVLAALKGVRGLTANEALVKMKKFDEGWVRVHSDQVEHALCVLEESEKVWRVGNGGWGLVLD